MACIATRLMSSGRGEVRKALREIDRAVLSSLRGHLANQRIRKQARLRETRREIEAAGVVMALTTDSHG